MPFYKDKTLTVEFDELGDTWLLEGIVIGNGENSLIMQTPFGSVADPKNAHVFAPTIEDLETWLKHSDDPVTKLYHDKDNKIVAAVVRKATRQLDQGIVWKCYQRDNYTCVYCEKTGLPLTYDHFLAQAYGGQTTMANGRTACRRCNKIKGHKTIEQWVIYTAEHGLNSGLTLPVVG